MSHAARPLSAEQAALAAFGEEEAIFVRRLAASLGGRHAGNTQEMGAAQSVVIRSIFSYAPESQDELLHAARLVSLSMTQLDLLSEAADPAATAPAKAKLATEAMRLERTILQSQKCLRQRQMERKAEQEAAQQAVPKSRTPGDAPVCVVTPSATPKPAPAAASATSKPAPMAASQPPKPAPPPRPAPPAPSLPPRSPRNRPSRTTRGRLRTQRPTCSRRRWLASWRRR
ncbi:MAG: hypothetical protein ACJ8AI_05100 [Rhodopila sp.]